MRTGTRLFADHKMIGLRREMKTGMCADVCSIKLYHSPKISPNSQISCQSVRLANGVIILFFSIALSGCIGFKPFQPPPGPSESWAKAGASEGDVTAALLECGFTQPRGRVPGLQERMTLDEDALALLCMEHSGFTAKYGNSYADFCRNFKGVEACKAGTTAPRRDVEKRLSSRFCARFPRADVCH
jgi:hypothetical protein